MGPCIGEKISDDFKDPYLQMVSHAPKKKPDIGTILNHPWMTSINNMDLKELNNSLKEKFKSIKKMVETFVTLEIKQNEDKKESGKYYTRSGIEEKKKKNLILV